jgi:7-cyano-7-deazaguanine reductase
MAGRPGSVRTRSRSVEVGLETVKNPQQGRPYTIECVFPEFTAVYPVTNEPVFATVTIRYVPGARCIESVSLKQYLGTYRNEALSCEAAANRIVDDLVQACHPVKLVVIVEFTVRGGIATTVTVDTAEAGV